MNAGQREDHPRLEDDPRDILVKARTGLRLRPEELAEAAEVDLRVLSRMESGGSASDGDWRCVAEVLGLAPDPLLDLVHGRWRPPALSGDLLSVVEAIPSYMGDYEVLCYLLASPGGGPAGLFDCGMDPDAVIEAIERRDAQLETIFITHRHGDHVGALEPLLKRRKPRELVLPMHGGPGMRWRIGPWTVERLPTPGHTAESVSYLVLDGRDEPRAVFAGDLLFAGSVGGARYDYRVLLRSIRERILTLDDDVAIFPGHGPPTTVGHERRRNPFLARIGAGEEAE